MLTVLYAHTSPHLAFRAVDPGYTATDFNGHRGLRTVEEGAQTIVKVAPGERAAGPLFADADGDLPW